MDQNNYLTRLVEEFSIEEKYSEIDKNEFLKILNLLIVIENKGVIEEEVIINAINNTK